MRAVSGRLRWLLVALVVVAVAAGGLIVRARSVLNPGCDPNDPCVRIYFAGNSYTAVNDLPTMFGELAWSGGHRMETGVNAPGGWTLADHANSSQTVDAARSGRWTYVVLQEQSEIPASRSARESHMYPAARRLVADIKAAGETPLLFMTWGHRSGWPEAGLPDYVTMQAAIDDGYLTIAREQRVAVAPVGVAWADVYSRRPSSDLWQSDGSHPTDEGTYLAACVFYATVFRASPVGLGFHSRLSDAEAARVQAVAADVVLNNLSMWGLAG